MNSTLKFIIIVLFCFVSLGLGLLLIGIYYAMNNKSQEEQAADDDETRRLWKEHIAKKAAKSETRREARILKTNRREAKREARTLKAKRAAKVEAKEKAARSRIEAIKATAKNM